MRYLCLIAGLAFATNAWCAETEHAAAQRFAKAAEKAEHDGKIVEAYLLWVRAATAEPYNQKYWTSASRLRAPASVISEKPLPTVGVPDAPKPANPDVVGTFTRQQLGDIERMTGPPHLTPVPGTKSFHLRGDSKSLFEQVAAEYHYTVIFDKDYDSKQSIRFDLGETDYIGALHALEAATNSFIVPLSAKSMLVAQDTQVKRQDLEPNEAIGILIPERTSVQEAQELLMMVQQSLEIRRAALDPVKRMVYIRDRVSKVELARAIFNELSNGKPQVTAEIEFLSVGKSTSLDFGLTIPTQFPLVDFGSVLHSVPSIPSGFAKFLAFGGGSTFMGIGLTDAALFATASRSDATSLLRTTITASDGQPATLHVGDKYPIQTGAYVGLGGVTGGGTTYAVVSTASYADVGVTAVSNTGSMTLQVNGQSFPITIPTGANSLIGIENIINAMGTGVVAQTIPRGTTDRPYSLLVIASTLGISSIQLIDDPTGKSISLLKTADETSSISTATYANETASVVSKTLSLSLVVGTTATPITLTDATNNLDGLRDAINAASAGVTAAVLNNGAASTTTSTVNPFYMQIVANTASTGEIQVYDDPTGANTALFSFTDEVNQSGNSLGQTVAGTSSSSLGQTYTPPPTFNFEDLGLVLKMTPYVHDLDEVTLELEAEFKVLGTGSYNGIPVISTRKFQGKIRLRTSEYAIVAGLTTDTNVDSFSGLAGLSSVPYLGQLFRHNTKTDDSSQVLIVIKPHITNLPPSEFVTKTLWFGSEMKPLTVL